jgi:hypothetical protein
VLSVNAEKATKLRGNASTRADQVNCKIFSAPLFLLLPPQGFPLRSNLPLLNLLLLLLLLLLSLTKVPFMLFILLFLLLLLLLMFC